MDTDLHAVIRANILEDIHKQYIIYQCLKCLKIARAAVLLKNNDIKVKNIDILKIDTFDIKNKFFSARRALKLKHDDYGRNISIIMLN